MVLGSGRSMKVKELNNEGQEPPFWRKSRSLTFIVQLQFAPALVLQLKAFDWILQELNWPG